MLDPNWTPEAGYSHADALLRILEAHDSLDNHGQLTENPQEASTSGCFDDAES